MRIGIAAESDMGLQARVSRHFGRCSHYVLVDVEDNSVKEVATIENPFHKAHEEPGRVPSFIRDQGVDVIIAGSMGGQAMGFFMGFGIQTVTRAMGSVKESLDNYLAGNYSDSTRFIS
ncbi:MAG: NifB/NifX family molybdenum-iron cluster-binding protein [Deltaproteobacteria bacterium]|nr:NifB/NifX family molybdenum-iron cluster-binding protein [Deltaproteobacteria bacterium]